MRKQHKCVFGTAITLLLAIVLFILIADPSERESENPGVLRNDVTCPHRLDRT